MPFPSLSFFYAMTKLCVFFFKFKRPMSILRCLLEYHRCSLSLYTLSLSTLSKTIHFPISIQLVFRAQCISFSLYSATLPSAKTTAAFFSTLSLLAYPFIHPSLSVGIEWNLLSFVCFILFYFVVQCQPPLFPIQYLCIACEWHIVALANQTQYCSSNNFSYNLFFGRWSAYAHTTDMYADLLLFSMCFLSISFT